MMIERLFVIWRHPASGTRYVIGSLARTDSGYAFDYQQELPFADGFALLPEFPQHTRHYVASYLFPTFAQRVPSPARSDRAALMHAWGVENPDDLLEVLARSGGIQMTDRLELAEYRADEDELEQPLDIRVAGATHYAPGSLREGDALDLRREPQNEHDPKATLVLFQGTHKIGYVPKQYAGMIARLIDGGVALGARAVRQLVLPPEGGRWVVRVSRG